MVARAFALLANFSNVLSNALRTDQPGNVRAMVLMHNSPEMLLPTDVDGALAYRELGGFFDQGQGPDHLYRHHVFADGKEEPRPLSSRPPVAVRRYLNFPQAVAFPSMPGPGPMSLSPSRVISRSQFPSSLDGRGMRG